MSVETRKVVTAYKQAETSLLRQTRMIDYLWVVDVPSYEPSQPLSYDYEFRKPLISEGYTSFQDLLAKRKQQGLSTHVLDVFGSGYFVADYLDIVDSITGLRLTDPTQQMLADIQEMTSGFTGRDVDRPFYTAQKRIERIRDFPNWKLIQGNAYAMSTWNNLDAADNVNVSEGYNIIVAKPEAAFDESTIFSGGSDTHSRLEAQMYGLHFLRLLDRAYKRLSPQTGMLITDVPAFLSEGYVDKVADLLNNRGVKANLYEHDQDSLYPERKHLKLIKTPSSPRKIEQIVRSSFLAA